MTSVPAETKKRILFVDDEAAVLAALENLLRRQRRLWDMSFAMGGQAALEVLARQPVDVVVSDMRMPGMDGAALLRRVQDLQPEAVRIVLSGHAERDMVLRALTVAHQYMSKPCDVNELQRVIERACSLQRTLGSPRIRELVGRLDALPSAPAVFRALTEALEQPATSVKDLARIVERDPGMCAKVLQLANSAFFGRAQRLTGIAQAVTFLGIDILRGLALTAGVFSAAERLEPHLGTSVEALQRHALETAFVGRAIAPPELRDDAFTAGLLHDVGRLVLASCVPEQSAAISAEAKAARRPLAEVERAALGTTHAEVGAYLLGVWGLPNHIVEAVALHDSAGDPPSPGCDLATYVHVADVLANELGGAPIAIPFDEQRLSRAGVLQHVALWRSIALATLRGERAA